MLLEKEKIKKRMVEFIIDSYWMKSITQFKDVEEKFSAPPFALSKGSVANYLDELVSEHKIMKWREGSNVFYGPPKMPMPAKISIATTVSCLVAWTVLFLTSTKALLSMTNFLSIWNIVFLLAGLNVGVAIICFLWSRQNKALNSK
jgi:hypothetical protein